jgi:hypothetical protein
MHTVSQNTVQNHPPKRRRHHLVLQRRRQPGSGYRAPRASAKKGSHRKKGVTAKKGSDTISRSSPAGHCTQVRRQAGSGLALQPHPFSSSSWPWCFACGALHPTSGSPISRNQVSHLAKSIKRQTDLHKIEIVLGSQLHNTQTIFLQRLDHVFPVIEQKFQRNGFAGVVGF